MKKDKIKFRKEWRDYAQTLSDEDSRKFTDAVEAFTVDGDFPQGLPPEVEHYFFTKIVPNSPTVNQGETDESGNKVREYPKFKFRPEWAYYIDKLDDWKRQLSMYDNISLYGCYGVEDEFLHADDEAYFNKKIRPELDRQHRLLEKGKDI